VLWLAIEPFGALIQGFQKQALLRERTRPFPS